MKIRQYDLNAGKWVTVYNKSHSTFKESEKKYFDIAFKLKRKILKSDFIAELDKSNLCEDDIENVKSMIECREKDLRLNTMQLEWLDEALPKLDNPQRTECQQQTQVDKTELYNKEPKGKGRPKGTLKDKMICEDVDKMLSKLHQLMNDRKGKEAALIITACIKAGIMTKPTFKQVSDEFGDVGNQSGYNRNMRERPFTDMEIEAIIKKLKE